MDYGKVFSRAWEITWENKFLWVLGFLMALGSGGGGGSGRSNFNTGGTPTEAGQQIENFMEQYAPLLIGLVCVVGLIVLVLWLVRLAAEAGLINAVDRIDQGNKVTLGEAFSSGTPFLGRMILLNLLMYAPFIVVALVGFASFLGLGGAALFGAAASNSPEGIFASLGVLVPVLCLMGCVLGILGILVNAIYPFAVRSTVLGSLGVVDSIRNGWNLFRSHLVEVLITWLILIGIGLVFGFAAALVLLPLGFLAAGPAFFSAVRGGSIGVAEIAPIVAGGFCIGVLGAIISSVVTTYQSAVFTLAYRVLAEKKPPVAAY